MSGDGLPLMDVVDKFDPLTRKFVPRKVRDPLDLFGTETGAPAPLVARAHVEGPNPEGRKSELARLGRKRQTSLFAPHSAPKSTVLG